MNLVVTGKDNKSAPIIALVFKDGSRATYPVGCSIRGVRHKNQRPVRLEWHYCETVPATHEVLEWVNTELRWCFDTSTHLRSEVERITNG